MEFQHEHGLNGVCRSMSLCIADSAIASDRSFVVHTTPENYIAARMDCIRNNGDLPRLDTAQLIDDVIGNVTSSVKAAANSSDSSE